jgi:hypothetical protein
MRSTILSKFKQKKYLSKLEREAKSYKFEQGAKSYQNSNANHNPIKIRAEKLNWSGKQNSINSSGEQHLIRIRMRSTILLKLEQEFLSKLEREAKS